MRTKNTTAHVVIDGITFEGKVDLVYSLISSGLLTEVQPKAEVKAEKKPSTKGGKGKKASTPKVLRVDNNGVQWIGKFNENEYRAKCKEMYPQYDKLHSHALRVEVYRALGWVL